MGFMDDQSDSEAESNTMVSEVDEESEVANGKENKILKHPYTHRISSPNDPRISTTKSNDLLSITRLRRKGITESEEIWEELEDDTVSELAPFSHRKSSAQSTPSPKPTSRGLGADQAPNEATSLLGRSGTGRSYRDKGRRRSSHLIESQERDRRRKSASSQEAQGGWWRMKRWFKGRDWEDKGKGRDDDNRNGDGNGNGNGA